MSRAEKIGIAVTLLGFILLIAVGWKDENPGCIRMLDAGQRAQMTEQERQRCEELGRSGSAFR